MNVESLFAPLTDAFQKTVSGSIRPAEFAKLKTKFVRQTDWTTLVESSDAIVRFASDLKSQGVINARDLDRIAKALGVASRASRGSNAASFQDSFANEPAIKPSSTQVESPPPDSDKLSRSSISRGEPPIPSVVVQVPVVLTEVEASLESSRAELGGQPVENPTKAKAQARHANEVESQPAESYSSQTEVPPASSEAKQRDAAVEGELLRISRAPEHVENGQVGRQRVAATSLIAMEEPKVKRLIAQVDSGQVTGRELAEREEPSLVNVIQQKGEGTLENLPGQSIVSESTRTVERLESDSVERVAESTGVPVRDVPAAEEVYKSAPQVHAEVKGPQSAVLPPRSQGGRPRQPSKPSPPGLLGSPVAKEQSNNVSTIDGQNHQSWVVSDVDESEDFEEALNYRSSRWMQVLLLVLLLGLGGIVTYPELESFLLGQDGSSRPDASLEVVETHRSEVAPLKQDEAEPITAALIVPDVAAAQEGWSRPTVVTESSELSRYLDALCPGKVLSGEGSPYCSQCPAQFPQEEGELTLDGAIRGSFSNEKAREVFLVVSGCGSGFNFSDALIGLRETNGRIELLGIEKGMSGLTCDPWLIDDQQALLCRTLVFGGGSAEKDIWAVSIREGKLEIFGIADYIDNSGTCRYDGHWKSELMDVFVEDIDADGASEFVALVTDTTASYVPGRTRSPDAPCTDVEKGWVRFSESKRVFAGSLRSKSPRVFTTASEAIQSVRVREFLAKPNGAASDEVLSLTEFEDASDSAWMIHQRRLAAFRNSGDLVNLKKEIAILRSVFPERSESLLIHQGEACEEYGDYTCARATYLELLGTSPDSRGMGRAIWFFVTAPKPFRNTNTAMVLISTQSKKNSRVVLAMAELQLQAGEVAKAQATLEKHSKGKKSSLIAERLAELKVSPTALSTPRPVLPKRSFKVPQEWAGGIPQGPIAGEERLFAAELKAIEYRNNKQFDESLNLYRELSESATNSFVINTFRLGLGRVHQRAGENDKALLVYEKLNKSSGLKDWRVKNRLAWFLLTRDTSSPSEIKRGLSLALEVAKATHDSIPSVLDTVAEGLIRSGEKVKARSVLLKCIALDPSRSYYKTRLANL